MQVVFAGLPASQRQRLIDVFTAAVKGAGGEGIPKKASERVVACFKEFDINGDGMISLDELVIIMNKINTSKTLTEFEIRDVFEEIDRKDDGTIDLEEFGAWMKTLEGDSNSSPTYFEGSGQIETV
mmetsp:Transcript_61004/g.101295  ORF Transcript_61004/g.101295 Transcript_61004/m.101295 type:complete len:126 (+) Transcript_61004:1-378(+)